jgi:hypothetical protein
MRPAGWSPAKAKISKTAKAKRRTPLPSWLAAAILLGALVLIGIIFALRLSQAGYEGPDIYPEFRELKKQYMALEQKKAAESDTGKAGEKQASPENSAGKSDGSATAAGSAGGGGEPRGK